MKVRATPELAEIVGKRLRELRTERPATLKEISEGCGVTLSVLHRALRGEATPAADALVKLALFYGVSLDWLAGLSDVRKPRKKRQLAS